MKYIISIILTVLIIYLFQTTINNENRIIKLEQKITELQYRINDIKIREYKNYFWDNKLK
ncbi:hypothetical protein [Brachyspira sp.]|uniref:hypothetical protein n=1 Tax=Brachyspira sp. TaxID=1977261 RepID=UPI003D7DD854